MVYFFLNLNIYKEQFAAASKVVAESFHQKPLINFSAALLCKVRNISVISNCLILQSSHQPAGPLLLVCWPLYKF